MYVCSAPRLAKPLKIVLQNDIYCPKYNVHPTLCVCTRTDWYTHIKTIDDKFILSNYALGSRFVCQLLATVMLFSDKYILVIKELMLKFMTYVFRKLKMLVYNLMETLK